MTRYFYTPVTSALATDVGDVQGRPERGKRYWSGH